ncbi:MAG: DinB family protein [Anaerolineae bacterium]|nr:DinB family protein [Anaerolineae bacterium]
MTLTPNDGQILKHLQENLEATKTFIRTFPAEKLTTPCAPGEWTIKEILVHVSDTERIFAYRALRIARQDPTELPGFDQNAYVPASGANARDIEAILDEYTAVRMATITLLESFSEDRYSCLGTASENPLSVRAAAYIIAGHELHHMNSIRENYL